MDSSNDIEMTPLSQHERHSTMHPSDDGDIATPRERDTTAITKASDHEDNAASSTQETPAILSSRDDREDVTLPRLFERPVLLDPSNDGEVARYRKLAASYFLRLNAYGRSIHNDVNRFYALRSKLDWTIKQTERRRRSRPWQYLTCFSNLAALRSERELADDQLHYAHYRMSQLMAEGLRHCEEYGRVVCLQFCNAIMTRLPREIRDLIYEAMLPPAQVLIEKLYAMEDFRYLYWYVPLQAKLNKCDYRFQLRFGPHDLPFHCLETKYVGEGMLHEIVATWDRTMIYALDVRRLPHLLTSDYWQHGRTASDAIHNLEIWVPIPKYQLCGLDHEHSSGPSGIHQDQPEVLVALRHLFNHKVEARITVVLLPADEDTRCVDVSRGQDGCKTAAMTYCKPVEDILSALEEQGLRVVVFEIT